MATAIAYASAVAALGNGRVRSLSDRRSVGAPSGVKVMGAPVRARVSRDTSVFAMAGTHASPRSNPRALALYTAKYFLIAMRFLSTIRFRRVEAKRTNVVLVHPLFFFFGLLFALHHRT